MIVPGLACGLLIFGEFLGNITQIVSKQTAYMVFMAGGTTVSADEPAG